MLHAVEQHVLEVHQVAVVHPLRVVVHVVEMQDAGVVRLHHLFRQQQALRHVLRHGAGHVVALHRVDRRVLVRVLLLRLLVRAVDECEYLAVRRVVLALQLLDEPILDVLLRHRVGARLLDLRLNQVLDLLHAQRAVVRPREILNLLGYALDARLGELVRRLHRIVGLADRGGDLAPLEFHFLAAALDDVHVALSSCHFAPARTSDADSTVPSRTTTGIPPRRDAGHDTALRRPTQAEKSIYCVFFISDILDGVVRPKIAVIRMRCSKRLRQECKRGYFFDDFFRCWEIRRVGISEELIKILQAS